MKRLMGLMLVIGLVAMFGCAQEKPEAAAKKIFDQQAAGHEGLSLDTSGLNYALIEQDGDKALVEVTGVIPVKATIALVKLQGKWVPDMPGETVEAAPAEH